MLFIPPEILIPAPVTDTVNANPTTMPEEPPTNEEPIAWIISRTEVAWPVWEGREPQGIAPYKAVFYIRRPSPELRKKLQLKMDSTGIEYISIPPLDLPSP